MAIRQIEMNTPLNYTPFLWKCSSLSSRRAATDVIIYHVTDCHDPVDQEVTRRSTAEVMKHDTEDMMVNAMTKIVGK